MCGVGGVDPESGGQHTIVGRRCAAALNVTQHGHPHFLVDPLLHLVRQLRGHPGELLVAEFVDAAFGQLHRTRRGFGTLGHHADEVRRPTLEPPLDQPAHLFDVERLLGNQGHVSAGGEPAVQCDPAGVAAHHLDEHHPLVRLGRGVQPVDGLGGDGQRGVVPERHVGAVDVVVDGLRHPDHGDVLLRQPVRGRQRALAADRDQHVDAVVVQRLLDLVQPSAQLVGMHAGGAEHRAALGQQAVVAIVVLQLDPPVFQQPAPAVPEADHRRAVAGVARAYDRANHRVQAWTVAAAGEYSDAHGPSLPSAPFPREQTQNHPQAAILGACASARVNEEAGQIAAGSGPRAAS